MLEPTPSTRAVLGLLLLAGVSVAHGGTVCLAPGEPIQWRADYCMLRMGTDDEIPVSGCIAAEGRRRFPNPCAANTHFKKRMCELMIRAGTRAGTLDGCVRDPDFKGRTVRNGGVGG